MALQQLATTKGEEEENDDYTFWRSVAWVRSIHEQHPSSIDLVIPNCQHECREAL